MPIYEYQCSNCSHHLEAIQKFSDEPLRECPECHQSTLQKQVSNSAFHLKGGGWYVTDFRDKGKKPTESKTTATNDASTDKKSGGSSSSTDSSSG